MAQLSRPYQIALAALGLFALVWFAALHRPGSGPGSGPGSSPASHAAPAQPTPVYHGAAPGVEGLTRAVAKAHGTVAQSQERAKQLQSKSAALSGEGATTTAPATGHATTTAPAAAVHGAQKTQTHATGTHATHASKSAPTHVSAATKARAEQAAQQAVLASELKHGKVVLLLFWNPKSTDDKSVRKALQAVSAHQKGKVAVHIARAGQVGRYGSVTRDVQVYQTPTLLIVGKKGLAVTMTGLVDRYAIEQAIREARKASSKA